ncbi:MAG: hypothetical protein ABIP29_01080, partial [Candidatus Eisenbacteria bacterium]
ARRVRVLSPEPFYLTTSFDLESVVLLEQGEPADAGRALEAGRAAGAHPATLRAVEAKIAARAGRLNDAGRLFDELESTPGMGMGALQALAEVALRLGRPEAALHLLARPLIKDMAPVFVRLDTALHPLLDGAPFAPRRMDVTLVWPLEAPMIDRARFRLFREVKIESGLPEGSDVR